MFCMFTSLKLFKIACPFGWSSTPISSSNTRPPAGSMGLHTSHPGPECNSNINWCYLQNPFGVFCIHHVFRYCRSYRYAPLFHLTHHQPKCLHDAGSTNNRFEPITLKLLTENLFAWVISGAATIFGETFNWSKKCRCQEKLEMCGKSLKDPKHLIKKG